MNEPTPQARQMLQAAVDEIRPTSADRQRIRAAIGRSVHRGGAPAFDGTVPPEARGRTTMIAVAAGLTLAAAAAVLLWVRPMMGEANGDASDPSPAAAVFEGRAPQTGGAASSRVPKSPRSDVPESPPTPEPAEPPVASEPSPVDDDSPPQAKPKRKPSTSAADIPGELAVLRRARTAMSAGDYAGVLRVVGEYRKRYGSGAFAQEAAALRVLALCESGRKGGAKAARNFLRRYPSSLNAPRIRRACDVP